MLPSVTEVGLAAVANEKYFDRKIVRIEGRKGLYRRLAAKGNGGSNDVLAYAGGTSVAVYARWQEFDRELVAAGYALPTSDEQEKKPDDNKHPETGKKT
jgi:hypothetical protein